MGLALLGRMAFRRDLSDESRDKLWRGLGAGAIATLLMTGLLFAAPALGGTPDTAVRALVALRARPLLVLVALVVHFSYGGVAGAMYTVGARRVSLGSGLCFGAALWAVAVLVYAPLIGLGFAASHEPALAALALPAHLLYGMTLGALGPRGEITQPIHDRFPLTFVDA
jgi:uncharacterized membrane protein YagU involved in acid resistance